MAKKQVLLKTDELSSTVASMSHALETLWKHGIVNQSACAMATFTKKEELDQIFQSWSRKRLPTSRNIRSEDDI
jgi:N-acetylglucosamine-6-phosphate deacetylase